jgi:hypothetical protein
MFIYVTYIFNKFIVHFFINNFSFHFVFSRIIPTATDSANDFTVQTTQHITSIDSTVQTTHHINTIDTAVQITHHITTIDSAVQSTHHINTIDSTLMSSQENITVDSNINTTQESSTDFTSMKSQESNIISTYMPTQKSKRYNSTVLKAEQNNFNQTIQSGSEKQQTSIHDEVTSNFNFSFSDQTTVLISNEINLSTQQDKTLTMTDGNTVFENSKTSLTTSQPTQSNSIIIDSLVMVLISLFFVLKFHSVTLVVSLTIAVVVAFTVICTLLIFVCYKKRAVLLNGFLRLTRRTQPPARTTARNGIEIVDVMGARPQPPSTSPQIRGTKHIPRPNRPPPPPPPPPPNAMGGARPKDKSQVIEVIDANIGGATGQAEKNDPRNQPPPGYVQNIDENTDETKTPSPKTKPPLQTYSRPQRPPRPHPPFLPIRPTHIPVGLPQFSPLSPLNNNLFDNITLPRQTDQNQIENPFRSSPFTDTDSFTNFDMNISVNSNFDSDDSSHNTLHPDDQHIDPNETEATIHRADENDTQDLDNNNSTTPHNDFDNDNNELIEHANLTNSNNPFIIHMRSNNTNQSEEMEENLEMLPIGVNNPFHTINIDLDLTPNRDPEEGQGPPALNTRSHD